MKNVYGQRTCLNCKQDFIASYASQVCCCDKCRKEREKLQKRDSAKKVRDSEIRKLKARIEELEAQLEKAQVDGKKEEAPKDQKSESAGVKKENGNPPLSEQLTQKCLRSNVIATHLPCGRNELCWSGDAPCEKAESSGYTPKDVPNLHRCKEQYINGQTD